MGQMLIGIKKRIIFVSNLKTASTEIENRLGRHCEISITRTEFGKHMSISEIEQRFNWIFEYVPLKEFLVFGVIRDPLSYLLSLYNFHSGPDFDGEPHSTRGVPFDAYVDDVLRKQCWMTRPQSNLLANDDGRLRITHLIDFSRVGPEVQAICRFMGVDHGILAFSNVSPRVAGLQDYRPDQIEAIRERYAADYALMAAPPRDARIPPPDEQPRPPASILPEGLARLMRRG